MIHISGQLIFNPSQQGPMTNSINKPFCRGVRYALISLEIYTLYTKYLLDRRSTFFRSAPIERQHLRKEREDHRHINNCTTSYKYYLDPLCLYRYNVAHRVAEIVVNFIIKSRLATMVLIRNAVNHDQITEEHVTIIQTL